MTNPIYLALDLPHLQDGLDLIRQRPAVGVAQHQAVGTRLGRSPQYP